MTITVSQAAQTLRIRISNTPMAMIMLTHQQRGPRTPLSRERRIPRPRPQAVLRVTLLPLGGGIRAGAGSTRDHHRQMWAILTPGAGVRAQTFLLHLHLFQRLQGGDQRGRSSPWMIGSKSGIRGSCIAYRRFQQPIYYVSEILNGALYRVEPQP